MSFKELQERVGLHEARIVLLPGHDMTIDKHAGYLLLKSAVGHPLKFEFWRTNRDLPRELLKDYINRGVFPLDVGPQKYHRRRPKMGSSVEALRKDFNIPVDEAWLKLEALLAENNRTGMLKGNGQFPVAYACREAARLELEPEAIFRHMQIVINAWLDAERQLSGEMPADYSLITESFKDLRERTSNDQNREFTVGQFITNVSLLHQADERARPSILEAREAAEFFIEALLRMRQELRYDIERFRRDLKREFTLPECKNAKALFIWDTKMYNAGRLVFKKGYALLVCFTTTHDGRLRFNLMTNKRFNLDISPFVEWVFENESDPECLHYHRNAGALHNGTDNLFEEKPADVTGDVLQFERKLKELVRYGKRKHHPQRTIREATSSR